MPLKPPGGVGVRVGVAVTVGVGIRAGVRVMVGVGVRVGVRVGVAVRIGVKAAARNGWLLTVRWPKSFCCEEFGAALDAGMMRDATAGMRQKK